MFSSQPPRSAFLHPSAYKNHGHGVSNFYRFGLAFDSQDCHDQMAREFRSARIAVTMKPESHSATTEPLTHYSLLFIQILAGNIILRHLVRANLLLVSVTSVFHACHCVGLERVSFLDQLGHTLRICTFDVGQPL